MHRRVLSQLLTLAGYEVYQAVDGSTAIALAKSHRPSVILLASSRLLGMEGSAVLTGLQAQSETASVPVIFLSDLEAPLTKGQVFALGAADYLDKPFHSEEVLARVGIQVKLQQARQQQQRLCNVLEKRVQARTEKLKIVHKQLLYEAMQDVLTRLPNRLSFVQRLNKLMSQRPPGQDSAGGHASSNHVAVVFLDCDRFNRINTSLGHDVGDQLLKGIAERLTKFRLSQPIVDLVARFGGDEFALLLVHPPDKDGVVEIADHVVSLLARPFSLDGHDIVIRASIGLVWGDPSYTKAEQLLRDADVAMYRAKDSNLSSYCWFQSAMHHRAVSLFQLETDFRQALEREEFELYYQPIVDLARLEIISFEALVRWRHPTRGLIPPDEFIGFAEENGFIVQLGAQVLHMVCTQIAQWERANVLPPNLTISVNMAVQQLLHPDILAQIFDTITFTGMAPHRLHLELTERSVIDSNPWIDNVLRSLKHRHIQLSLDDFGTGYSALNYLHALPINCLKIDRSFVQPMMKHSGHLGIVPLIIKIAKRMNLKVIVEGIETLAQLRQFQRLGCGYGQGYLFQRALPADQAISLLKAPLNPRLIRARLPGSRPAVRKNAATNTSRLS